MLDLKQQKSDFLLLICTTIIGIISYLFNLGWIRLIFFIPMFVYSIIFLVIGINYSLLNKKKGKITFYLSLLTYIFFNVFLFDGGDIGPSYCFFGLIKIYENDATFFYLSIISLIISLICMIINIVEIISINNKKNI